jgi:hypothetical protein
MAVAARTEFHPAIQLSVEATSSRRFLRCQDQQPEGRYQQWRTS